MADPTPTPATAARQVLEQLRGLWKRLPRLARLGGLAALALLVGVILWTALSAKGERWVAVAPTMSAGDASELSALLAGRGIPQRIAAGGKGVEVPAARLAEARLLASSAGLPRGGVGLELLEHPEFGQSSFGEQVTFVRALQGELARSIQSLAPVESARVHVALGRRSVFRDADEPPAASVVLRVRPGARLTPEQVRGVKSLVASSVDGLDPEKVAVVDQHGTVLSDVVEERPGEDAEAREVAIGGKVRSLLENIVGPGHVAVVVAVDMDRRKISETIETFDGANTAVRSSNTTGPTANNAATTGGIAGVQGNLPGTGGAAGGAAAAMAPGASQIINYEVPRTVRQVEEPEERVGRIHLAILVDHRPDATGAMAPMPPEVMAQLASVARAAAGLDERRGDELEISTLPFAPGDGIARPLPEIAPAAPLLPVPLPVAAGAGAVLLVAAVTAFLMIRRRRRQRREAEATPTLALPAPLGEVERALAAPGEHEALPPPAEQRSLEERVVAAVRQDVPRAARILASWLAQPDPTPSKP